MRSRVCEVDGEREREREREMGAGITGGVAASLWHFHVRPYSWVMFPPSQESVHGCHRPVVRPPFSQTCEGERAFSDGDRGDGDTFIAKKIPQLGGQHSNLIVKLI